MACLTKIKNLEKILLAGAESRVMTAALKIGYSAGVTALILSAYTHHQDVPELPYILAIEGGALLGLSFLNQYKVGKHRLKSGSLTDKHLRSKIKKY